MEKINPYNQNNKLITSNDIINIMETLNINNFKINDILLYQRSFVHKSYCIELYKDTDFKNIDDSLELQEISYETMEFLGDSILPPNWQLGTGANITIATSLYLSQKIMQIKSKDI